MYVWMYVRTYLCMYVYLSIFITYEEQHNTGHIYDISRMS